MDSFYFSSFLFKDNHVLVEQYNLSEKSMIVKEELDGTDIDDIGNLEDLIRIVFIHQPSVYWTFPDLYFNNGGPVDPKFILSYLL